MNIIHHGGHQILLLTAGTGDKPLLRNLMQLYLHEISEFTGADPDDHGIFDYPEFDHYFTAEGRQEGRLPILIRIDGTAAGFAMINGFSLVAPHTPSTRHLSDFLILRKWRRRSIGKAVVREIFESYPGLWEIKQRREHEGAQRFWRNVIREYTAGGYKETELNDDRWDGFVQTFDNSSRL